MVQTLSEKTRMQFYSASQNSSICVMPYDLVRQRTRSCLPQCCITEDGLHLFVTDITETVLQQGAYTDINTYIGAHPPKSAGTHTDRIAVFAIKDQPNDTIGKLDARNSYAGLVNQLNQVGGNSDNILADGYVEGTYTCGDQTDKEMP